MRLGGRRKTKTKTKHATSFATSNLTARPVWVVSCQNVCFSFSVLRVSVGGRGLAALTVAAVHLLYILSSFLPSMWKNGNNLLSSSAAGNKKRRENCFEIPPKTHVHVTNPNAYSWTEGHVGKGSGINCHDKVAEVAPKNRMEKMYIFHI